MSQAIAVSKPTGASRTVAAIQIAAALGAFALVVWLAPVLMSGYWVKIVTSALIFSVAAASVSLIFSQLGMVTLCQQALMGVGGWFALRIGHAGSLPFEVALIGGGISAAVFGVMAGLPSLRTRGIYFALATLMIAATFQVVIGVAGFPDGGSDWLGRVHLGDRIMMPRPSLGESDTAYLRYCAVVTFICMALIGAHVRSKAGRAWAQIRRGEAAALVGGVNIYVFQIWAFALAGFLAGVSGGLLAANLGVLDPTAFPVTQSILLFAASIIGGAFNWFGPLVAGFLMRVIPGLLTDLNINGNVATILFGLALLHALITARQGISAQIARLAGRVAASLRGENRGPKND